MKKLLISICFLLFLAVGIFSILYFSVFYKSNPSNNNKLNNLSTIIGIDFSEYNIDIIDSKTIIKDENTEVYLKVMVKNNVDIYNEFEETEQAPPGVINSLTELGVDVDLLYRFGVKHKELNGFYIFGTEYKPYEVWFLSEETLSENEQTHIAFIYTCVPDRINISQAK